MDVTELLAFTMQNKASDLHLVSGQEPMLRLNGDLRPIKTGALGAETIRTMIYAVMTEEQRATYEREHETDFAIAFGEEARFRVNGFTTRTGPAAVFRTIPTVVPSLDKLGAPEIFKDFAQLDRGMVLVTGPTGSGKSTTLAAIINHINETQAKHILTIEDPVEFVHDNKQALVNHREVGLHTESFARALKSALREDPDVIMVGEMRDRETIGMALTAAETGHLVLGTLHTSSAPKTIDRIIDVFPGNEKEMVRAMLAGSMQAVITQKLLRKQGGGRVAVHEILIGTPAVRNLIRENKVPQIYSMMQVGSRFGMQTLEEGLKRLMLEGKITEMQARGASDRATDEDMRNQVQEQVTQRPTQSTGPAAVEPPAPPPSAGAADSAAALPEPDLPAAPPPPAARPERDEGADRVRRRARSLF